MINTRKGYSNIYRLLFALADCKVIYGNRLLRAKLQMQLYNVYSDIHYYFFARLLVVVFKSDEFCTRWQACEKESHCVNGSKCKALGTAQDPSVTHL